jgi:hypothetical protein
MKVATASDRSRDRLGLRAWLVVASLMAGAIHAAVVPEHAEDDWAFGLFFTLAAAFQIGWAIAAIRSASTRIYGLGALLNALLIAVWVASRTTGVPVGPHPWMREAIAVPDVTASLAELAILVGSLLAIRRMRQRRSLPRRSR